MSIAQQSLAAGARGVQWGGIATGGRCRPGLGAWQLHVVLTFPEQSFQLHLQLH